MPIQSTCNVGDELKWIGCIDLQGNACELSLRDLLLRAHELREIHDDSPLTTIALHRVALAVLHRCWRGKTRGERQRSWKAIWDAGSFDADAVDAYLTKWRDRFYLFDDQFPFYQTARLEMKESSPLTRLALEEQLTSDLFTNDESPQWQAPTPALAARLLVSTQSFALGFGKSSNAKIDGKEIEPPYSADAILLRGQTVWLAGKTVFETLMLNLTGNAPNENDAPCWELEASHALRDTLVNGKRRTQPPRGPMDRLTWQSRLIRLLPEEDGGRIVVKRVYFTQGRSLEKTADNTGFEPMKTYRSTKKEGYVPISLNEQKAAWRDAHVFFQQEPSIKQADCIQQAGQMISEGMLPHQARYNLHVVGLAAEPGKAGKFLLWRHDRMPAPAKILADGKLAEALHIATEEAEFVANDATFGMGQRMRRVCRLFLAPESDNGGRKPHKDDVGRLVAQFDPRRDFWPRLEAHFHRFLLDLGQAPENHETILTQWRRTVEREAASCFAEAIRALGTSPRAINAAAHVSGSFMTKANWEAWKAQSNQSKREVKA